VGEGGVEGVVLVLDGDGAGDEPGQEVIVDEVVLLGLGGGWGLAGLEGVGFGLGEVGKVVEALAEMIGFDGRIGYKAIAAVEGVVFGCKGAAEQTAGIEEDGGVGKDVEGEEVVVVGGSLVGVEGVGKGGGQLGYGLEVGQEIGRDAVTVQQAEEGIGVVAGGGLLRRGHWRWIVIG
jgi:hypothetical protein